jgi:hypothetical protein
MTIKVIASRISLVTEFTNDGLALALSMINMTTWSPAAILACEGYGWYVYNIPYRVCMTVVCGTAKGEGTRCDDSNWVRVRKGAGHNPCIILGRLLLYCIHQILDGVSGSR